jgi:hypothetical protein
MVVLSVSTLILVIVEVSLGVLLCTLGFNTTVLGILPMDVLWCTCTMVYLYFVVLGVNL